MTAAADDPVNPHEFAAHAENLDAVRALLVGVRVRCRQLGSNGPADGTMLGQALTDLNRAHRKQGDDMAYFEETLTEFASGLHRAASGRQELKTLIRRDDDVATLDGTPVIDPPFETLDGFMDTVRLMIRDRQWVEPHLAGATAIPEIVVPVDQVTAVLRSGGLQWTTTSDERLRQLIDDLELAGVAAGTHARLWASASADLHDLRDLLQQSLDQDMYRRDRLDIRSYLNLMANNVEVLYALGEVAAVCAEVLQAAADLILLTRDIIRGIIADLSAQVIIWALDVSTMATPAVKTERLGTIVTTSWRMAAFSSALTNSLTTLAKTANG